MLPAELQLEDSFEDILAQLPMTKFHAPIQAYLQNAAATQIAEPSKTIAPANPSDPARIGYPATLPVELALRIGSTRSICEAYGIDEDEWNQIRQHPAFLADLERAAGMVAQEGMSFKLKAKLQAEELLKTSWRTIHDITTPANVKADLIKATMRWAEYDNPKIDPNAVAASGAQFAIQINFSKP